MKSRRGLNDPERILVTRLRYLGDVILTTPVLAALARAYPGASIDYLCESPYDQILVGNPHLDQVHVLPRGEEADTRSSWRMLRGLRARRYDVVIDLFGNPRSAWITRLSGAPLRVGRGRFPRSLLFNLHPPEGSPDEAATRHHLRFAEALVGPVTQDDPQVRISETERREGRRILEDRGLGKDCVAILTGASWITREWPVTYFARLAALIRMEDLGQPVFIGQPGRRKRLDELRQLSHSRVSILPECDIRTLLGVLCNCRGLVTVDGGIMHAAIAAGVPTLAIFGNTEPRIWFPYDHLPHAELAIQSASCRPCHKRECEDPFCLTDITPEAVFSQLGALLKRARSGEAAAP